MSEFLPIYLMPDSVVTCLADLEKVSTGNSQSYLDIIPLESSSVSRKPGGLFLGPKIVFVPLHAHTQNITYKPMRNLAFVGVLLKMPTFADQLGVPASSITEVEEDHAKKISAALGGGFGHLGCWSLSVRMAQLAFPTGEKTHSADLKRLKSADSAVDSLNPILQGLCSLFSLFAKPQSCSGCKFEV